MFVETADAFLDFINTREDIREYLDVFPVTILNIDIGIVCSNAKPGNIVDASNCDKCVYYCTQSANPGKEPWKKVHEETFEEAHAKLNNADPSNNS